MLIIDSEELEAQGLLYQGASEFTFQGKVMESSLAFSMRLLETAKNLCQQELDAGNLCILIKKFNYITLWKEKQLERSKALVHAEETITSEKDLALPLQSQQSKPAAKTSRPVIYEPNSVNREPAPPIAANLPPAPIPQLSTPPRPLASNRIEDSESTRRSSNPSSSNQAKVNPSKSKRGNAHRATPLHHTSQSKASRQNQLTNLVSAPNALAQENGATAKSKQPLINGENTLQAVPSAKSERRRPMPTPPPAKSPANVQHPVDFDPTFLEQCQQALAYCIGPIAPLILEEVFAKNPPRSPGQLIDCLAKEIPNPQAALEFRQRLNAL
ncbi:MAG: hypothetical protein QNJ46_02505 [Leptolyngbyaceae cyanobacterium MO_188.B28]|nr:hypothetical protein [Leptolyngbyaceae cyanobacterium MO_188.B28]